MTGNSVPAGGNPDDQSFISEMLQKHAVYSVAFGCLCLYTLSMIVFFLRDQDEEKETWTGDFIFENEWQSFRTKKDRTLELTSVFWECSPGRRKVAIKVVDIFGNDTMKIIPVTIGGKV